MANFSQCAGGKLGKHCGKTRIYVIEGHVQCFISKIEIKLLSSNEENGIVFRVSGFQKEGVLHLGGIRYEDSRLSPTALCTRKPCILYIINFHPSMHFTQLNNLT